MLAFKTLSCTTCCQLKFGPAHVLVFEMLSYLPPRATLKLDTQITEVSPPCPGPREDAGRCLHKAFRGTHAQTFPQLPFKTNSRARAISLTINRRHTHTVGIPPCPYNLSCKICLYSCVSSLQIGGKRWERINTFQSQNLAN